MKQGKEFYFVRTFLLNYKFNFYIYIFRGYLYLLLPFTEFVYQIGSLSDGVEIDNSTHVVTYTLPSQITFDETTGEYTLTYTDEKNAANNAVTTFTYDAEKDEVAFTAPLYSNGIPYNQKNADGVYRIVIL